MIRKIHVSTFDIDVPLGPFNLIVGENGCGKTTVLRAILATHGNARASDSAARTQAHRYVDTILPVPVGRTQHRYAYSGGLDVHDTITAALTAARTDTPCVLDNLGAMLHPSVIARLIASLRTIGAQVIATTHSPDVVDCFEFSEVLVMHGGKVRRLSEHPESEKWSALVRAGEFWSTVGESWVSGNDTPR